jgi:hypothetical protein
MSGPFSARCEQPADFDSTSGLASAQKIRFGNGIERVCKWNGDSPIFEHPKLCLIGGDIAPEQTQYTSIANFGGEARQQERPDLINLFVGWVFAWEYRDKHHESSHRARDRSDEFSIKFRQWLAQSRDDDAQSKWPIGRKAGAFRCR